MNVCVLAEIHAESFMALIITHAVILIVSHR